MRKKKQQRQAVAEIVSLNEPLFSLVTGDPLAALDERLSLAVGSGSSCDSFTCSSFGGCASFSCGTFKVI